jgi:hypothetical protein
MTTDLTPAESYNLVKGKLLIGQHFELLAQKQRLK